MANAISDETLIARALEARDRAYAPYSKYQVGCAVVAGDAVYIGANVENASYGLCTCAERNAISSAVIDGHRAIDALAVATTSSPPAAPCGLCLQTITEFSPHPSKLRLILINPAGERRDFTLNQLFPHGFRPAQLPGGED